MNPVKLETEPKHTLALYLCLLSGLLGSFQFGWATGVINMPQSAIESSLDLDNFQWSVVVAAFTIGGLVGAQMAGTFADQHGRRPFLVWHSLFFITAGILQFAAGLCDNKHADGRHSGYALLVIGRVIVGIGGGGATVVVPMFLGEIADTKVRGLFGSFFQFTLVIAILVAQVCGLGLSTESGWKWLLIVSGLLGGLQLAMAPFLLETPKFLFSKGKLDEAADVLKKLRGYDDAAAQAELEEIRLASSSVPSPSLGQLLVDKRLRRPLIISVVLMYIQQLSGINAVFFFSTSFFTDAGIKDSNAGTCLIGAINVLSTGVAVVLVERAGRRRLLTWGCIGMLFSAVLLTVCLVVKQHASEHNQKSLGYLSILFVMIFVSFFELGPGPIPWAIGGEIFPEAPRATAMSFCAANNWFANTLIALFFNSVQKALGNYSFVPFAVVLAVGTVFVIKYVPETKGRTLAEIQAEFAQLDESHEPLLANPLMDTEEQYGTGKAY